MQTDMPFYDEPEEALKAIVQALGGAKRIAGDMWPDKSLDSATRYLQDCLNTSRAEKLDISQVMYLLKKANQAGYHSAFKWIADEVGYESKPISKEAKEDSLIKAVEKAADALLRATSALDRLSNNN
jgi:hypothetical protein